MEVYTALVIVHVVLFAYWLGGDWGVYVNARYVADPQLPLDERRREPSPPHSGRRSTSPIS